MASPLDRFLLWSPRVLGLLVAVFLGVFALDAVEQGATALLIHAAPALGLLLAVAASWRRPWVGALAFLSLAAVYTVSTLHRPDWILTIAVPLSVVGLLFVLSWRRQSRPSGDHGSTLPRDSAV